MCLAHTHARCNQVHSREMSCRLKHKKLHPSHPFLLLVSHVGTESTRCVIVSFVPLMTWIWRSVLFCIRAPFQSAGRCLHAEVVCVYVPRTHPCEMQSSTFARDELQMETQEVASKPPFSPFGVTCRSWTYEWRNCIVCVVNDKDMAVYLVWYSCTVPKCRQVFTCRGSLRVCASQTPMRDAIKYIREI